MTRHGRRHARRGLGGRSTVYPYTICVRQVAGEHGGNALAERMLARSVQLCCKQHVDQRRVAGLRSVVAGGE